MSRHLTLLLAGTVFASCALIGAGIHGLSAQETTVHATSSHTASLSREAGRYQLQDGQAALYLLDTETGRVWVGRNEMIPGKFNTLASGTNSVQLPITRMVWTEESPDWAKDR